MNSGPFRSGLNFFRSCIVLDRKLDFFFNFKDREPNRLCLVWSGPDLGPVDPVGSNLHYMSRSGPNLGPIYSVGCNLCVHFIYA